MQSTYPARSAELSAVSTAATSASHVHCKEEQINNNNNSKHSSNDNNSGISTGEDEFARRNRVGILARASAFSASPFTDEGYLGSRLVEGLFRKISPGRSEADGGIAGERSQTRVLFGAEAQVAKFADRRSGRQKMGRTAERPTSVAYHR